MLNAEADEVSHDTLSKYKDCTTHLYNLITGRGWDTSKPLDHRCLFMLVWSYTLMIVCLVLLLGHTKTGGNTQDAHEHLNGGKLHRFKWQKRKVGTILLKMLRYKPGHQEIFEPYTVCFSGALRVSYEDYMCIQMDNLGVLEWVDDEACE
ncbi:unnamed protein product [Peniophora sp. CBMAI 1063]|nr:unnamed protein product [Peniophora sp. CBMAI 1063]